MSEHDAVFSAFEEWMALKGFDLLNVRDDWDNNGIELDAYRAGAEWMRERCAKLADDADWDTEGEWGLKDAIARQVRAQGAQ